ncbi:MAG: hypothetical protein ACE5E6_10650 [Phycisphaerae bacterium]
MGAAIPRSRRLRWRGYGTQDACVFTRGVGLDVGRFLAGAVRIGRSADGVTCDRGVTML